MVAVPPLVVAVEGLPFRDRPPTYAEFTRLRLTLSTYRDGSGQLSVKGKGSFPGWRDFERATASAFGGLTRESKSVFDVEIPAEAKPYGLSCKTSKLPARQVYVLMEMANSAAKFTDELARLEIDYETDPKAAGCALIALIKSWHDAEAGSLDVAHSSYLVLTHDTPWSGWRVFWYSLDLHLPDPAGMRWERIGKRVEGFDGDDKIWEWYPGSGSQLKYRPRIAAAKWASDVFRLEEPPLENAADRAARYWPALWPKGT